MDNHLQESSNRGADDGESLPMKIDGPTDEKRRQSEQALDQALNAQARLAFLADASSLLAYSLDYETTLSTVAHLALPSLGAWCIVDLVEADGSMRRLAIVHPDPTRQVLARKLEEGWPPQRDDPIGAPVVMRTRRSEVIEEIDDEMLLKLAQNQTNVRILRELGIGCVIVVPLIARGEVLGAMTFITAHRNHRYSGADLELAEDLAARCAMAIDNARLFREAQDARTAAELANEAKSQFLATSSHEIRTPINAIIGYVQLLEMGLSGPLTQEQRVQLERIFTSSQHLLGLVNEILDLAKVESGQMKVERKRADLAEVVERAYSIVHPQILQCSLRVRRDGLASEPISYLGDPDRVRQVLINLLVNACKFTEPGGEVQIQCGIRHRPDPETRLSGTGPWAFVEIADTGHGIQEHLLERVFEPFVQGDGAHTRTQGGSGLGLAISRQLARLMGGDLTVRSIVGDGSRFTLWLPAASGLSPGGDGGRPLRDPRQFGLLADQLLLRAKAIQHAYVERLRLEPGLPRIESLSDVELRNNIPNLLASIVHLLELMHERTGTASGLLQDSSGIQQTICESHGRQRKRLGWREVDLHTDFRVLRAAVMEEISRLGVKGEELSEALVVLGRILDQAEHASFRAWRSAPGVDLNLPSPSGAGD